MERQALGSITLFVIAVHTALIFWAWLGYELSPPPKKPVKLIAKTIELNPQTAPRQRTSPAIPTENFDDVILSTSEEIAEMEEPIRALPKLDKASVKVSPKEEIQVQKKQVVKIEPKKPEKKVSPPPPKQKPEPVVKSAPAKKQEPKKTVAAAKPNPPKPSPSKPDPKKQALVNLAKERIANIQADNGKRVARGDLKVPEYRPQAVIAPEEGLSYGEISYRDELASHLQLLLKLPEIGKVQLKLTLGKTGKFVKLVITDSPSGLNKQHIEKSLPNLTLPGFGEQFGGAADYTFSITLTSDL